MPVEPKKLRGPVEAADQRDPDGSLSLRADRRSFLKKAGIGGAIAAGAVMVPASAFAADSSTTTTTAPASTTTTTTPQFLSPDLRLANFAQEVEVVASQAYTLLSPQLTDDSIKAMADSFSTDHQNAAVLMGALIDPTTPTEFDKLTVNAKLLEQFNGQIKAASGQTAALNVLWKMEEVVAATQLSIMGELKDSYNAGNLARVLAVDEQHAAIIAQLLGQPIDIVLPIQGSTTGALNPADFTS